MDVQLTEEQRQVRDLCRAFAAEALAPNARRWDADHVFPAEAVKQLGEMGLMGVAVPPEWGGAGMDTVAYAVAMEEISRGCAGTGVIMSVNNSLYCDPILLKFGTTIRSGSPRAARPGERLGCFALTEPEAAPTPPRMRTVAVRRRRRVRPHGTKNFITNGPQADVILVFAMTTRRSGTRASPPSSCRRTSGATRGEARRQARHPRSALLLDLLRGCAICRRFRLGEEADGFKVAMSTLDGGRIGIAAQALGIARARSRRRRVREGAQGVRQADRQHQAIQFMLADMATELDAARLLTLRAAWLKDRGKRHSAESAMAKLYASEVRARRARRRSRSTAATAT
jgi:butyryl-CoA dehydrogenase